MDKQTYIDTFKKVIATYKGATNGGYSIDNSFRYDNSQGCKVSINSCIQVMAIRHEALEWLHGLVVGNSINIFKYGSYSTIVIKKINYKRKINGHDVSDRKIIASFTDNKGYKIEPQDIIYQGNNLYQLNQAYKHAKPNGYAFINEYDVKNINQVIENYQSAIQKPTP